MIYFDIWFKKENVQGKDLIDVWFDSGAMPYAQWHYPFENKNYIDDNKFFPLIILLRELIKLEGGLYFTCNRDIGIQF